MLRPALLGSLLICAAAAGGCATHDPYSERDRSLERAATGAAIGGAVGAGAGAVVDGVSPVEGAIGGAVVGGAIGAATGNDRRWYRDERGYCYYVTRRGERRYDYDRRRC